jgi:ABC-type lipoprotein release transport system permease subunit
MVAFKSKFSSKFSISKWSYVNFELLKSLELTKYLYLLVIILISQDPSHHILSIIYIN